MRKGTRDESEGAALSRGWGYEEELAKKTDQKQPFMWQEDQESVVSGNQKKKVFLGKGNNWPCQILLIS